MPLFPAVLLVALAGAPADEPARADWADYQAAFGEVADSGFSPAAPPRQRFPSVEETNKRGGHLPFRFGAADQVHRDPAVRTASAQGESRPGLLRSEDSIPLAPPDANGAAPARELPTASIPTVLGSLAAVVGLFLVVAWVMRRTATQGSIALPREVVEVLGRTTLAGRQQLHLLRLGNKLILIALSPGGAETLTEVTDPAEVDRLTGLCYQAHPSSATSNFRQVMSSFGDPRGDYVVGGRGGDRFELSQLDAIAAGAGGQEGAHVR